MTLSGKVWVKGPTYFITRTFQTWSFERIGALVSTKKRRRSALFSLPWSWTKSLPWLYLLISTRPQGADGLLYLVTCVTAKYVKIPVKFDRCTNYISALHFWQIHQLQHSTSYTRPQCIFWTANLQCVNLQVWKCASQYWMIKRGALMKMN